MGSVCEVEGRNRKEEVDSWIQTNEGMVMPFLFVVCGRSWRQ